MNKRQIKKKNRKEIYLDMCNIIPYSKKIL